MSRDAPRPEPSPEPSPTTEGAAFLIGGGETGALLRATDWRTSRLGPVSSWPQSLRTSLGICLSSRFPIALYWGREFVMLYNDALIPMVGANKHPRAMGRPAFEVLPEIRELIEPLLLRVVDTGEAIWSEDLMLPLLRSEVQEESYFTFTYSPIRDESGAVGGVFCAVIETTDKLIEGRRLRLLHALAAATQAWTPAEACTVAATHIARAPADVPFALFYLLDEPASTATLAGAANIDADDPRAPAAITIGDDSVWPLAAVLASGQPQELALDDARNGARGAIILPFYCIGGARPRGFIVAGLSPMLSSSHSYARFHNLLAASVAQGVGNAAAYDAERRRAQALAELDRAKTTFFSNISHEFRTPLTLMLAPIQDMLALPAGAAVDHSTVELLHRNAQRLHKLVNTLLEFSRIEAGRIDAVIEPVDLAALTLDLASSFRELIERAGLALIVDCPPLPGPIPVDRDMWEKIVLNLLSNAFKFTLEGSITVRLTATDGAVYLEVADTGTGIAEKDLPRLFERFHRVEGARSRSHEGSGIGLALIHELVRMHGGEVRVRSTPDVGSIFTVHIPRAPQLGAREQAQRDSLYRHFMQAPFPVCVLRGPDHVIELANPSILQAWGVSPAVVGLPLLRALPQLHDQPFLGYLDQVLRTGLPYEGRTELARLPVGPGGAVEDVYFNFVYAPLRDQDDAVEGVLVSAFDVTDIVLARRESEQARQDAEAAARTQRDVREFQERFVAVLGHDLRNPLAAIAMGTGLLRQQPGNPATLRTLNRISSSTRRMSRMVEQILDLSRARIGGGLDIVPVPMDLYTTLNAVIDEVRGAHPDRRFEFDGSSMLGTWDRDRLEQVFSNLVSNAIHHGLPDSPIRVVATQDADCVHVDVHNEGSPIPDPLRAILFDPFRRGDRDASAAKSSGLGLGLFISREVVLAHGGEIDVHSTATGGTTFRVTLQRTVPTKQLEPNTP